MASIEFLEKRITGKEKEITKLTKKLERINKAKESGWTVNPYYYTERDLKATAKEIEEARNSLDDYKKALEEANGKANNRNIAAITEFLEGWKENVRKFYTEKFAEYIEEKEEQRKKEEAYTEWFNLHRMETTPAERKARSEKARNERADFRKKWSFLTIYETRKFNGEYYEPAFDSERFEKDIKQEAERKYDDIVERTNKITGTITSADGLKIGDKGDLNGYITGEKGTAKVETIGAGGYNIQCYHFRTLIHECK